MELLLQLDSISTPTTKASVITDPSGHFKTGDRVNVEEDALQFNEQGQGYYPVTISGPDGHPLHARRPDPTAGVEGFPFPTPRQSTQLYELVTG